MTEKEEVLCAGCCKSIGLKWIVAMDQKWHKYCFCCDMCKMPIDSKKSFFFEKGKIVYFGQCRYTGLGTDEPIPGATLLGARQEKILDSIRGGTTGACSAAPVLVVQPQGL